MQEASGSLVVVGCGIKTISHLSVEAIAYIQQADKVIYSVNEPVIEKWIKENNFNSESLDNSLGVNILRKKRYKQDADYILENVRNGQHVCVIFYGHPTVFAQTALDAAKQAKENGIFTLVLPGISAEDCLFADLLIDPGSCGCQSYEATDLLIRQRHIDITSHLILWQVGIIGALGSLQAHDNQVGIKILRDYLLKYYDKNHHIIAYEAAIYPHLKANINSFSLQDMLNIKLSSLTTFYIQPAHKKEINLAMLEALSMSIDQLR